MAARNGRILPAFLCWSFLALASCGHETSLAASNEAAASGMPASGPRPCASELGAEAARRRAEVCRYVSPATHPPCNAANSCAMIEDEIARSCVLIDGEGPSIPDCRPAPRSKEAAAAVVQRYYSALDARDYDTAWRQWGEDGPPRQTRDQFRAGFVHTRATRVRIDALGREEGAAGSIYLPVPVTVDATLDDGTRQRFRGRYVLRRVNGVEGTTPGQLRWHIDSAQLTAAPVE